MSTTLYNELDAKPTHHVHSENEPLPGAKGGSTTVDYSADTLNHIADQDSHPSEHSDTASTTHHDAHRPTTRSPPETTDLPQGEARAEDVPGAYPAEIYQGAGRFEGEPAPTTSGDTSEVAVNTGNKPLPASQGGSHQGAGFFEGEPAPATSGGKSEDVPVAVNTDNELPAAQGGIHQGAGSFEGESVPTTRGDTSEDVPAAVTDTDKPLPKQLPSSQSGAYPAETHQGAGPFEGEQAPTTSGDASEDVPVAANELSASQGGTYPPETHQGVGRFEGEPAPATSGGTSEDVPAAVTDTDNKPLPKKIPSHGRTYPAETHQGAGRFEGEPAPTRRSDSSELPDTAKKASLSDKIVGKTEKLVGKITRDSELQTKGAVRAQVGKN